MCNNLNLRFEERATLRTRKVMVEIVTLTSDSVLWEKLFFSYNVHLNYFDKLKIGFVRVPKSHGEYNLGYSMIVLEPLELIHGFRRVPNFLEYAVSEDGRVIRCDSLKPASIHRPKGDYYYSVVLFLERKQHSIRTGLHRLIAAAWCENDDYYNKIIVNHKDGNKKKNIRDNLEWVTYSENAFHAFKEGLRFDNKPCIIRSRKTGVIHKFHSFHELNRFLGNNQPIDTKRFSSGPVSRLLYDEYEVRVKGDDRPWFYEIGQCSIPNSRYKTTVVYPNGEEKIFWDNRDIIRTFMCWNSGGNIHSIVDKARLLNPDLRFHIEDRWKDKIVQTLKVETMEVVDESQWMRNAIKLMKTSRGAIKRLLEANEQRPINGYAVRYKTDKPWDIKPGNYIGEKVRVLITNTETKESREFSSLREIERVINISRFVSKRCMKTGTPYKNYTFTKLITWQSTLVEILDVFSFNCWNPLKPSHHCESKDKAMV